MISRRKALLLLGAAPVALKMSATLPPGIKQRVVATGYVEPAFVTLPPENPGHVIDIVNLSKKPLRIFGMGDGWVDVVTGKRTVPSLQPGNHATFEWRGPEAPLLAMDKDR